MRFSRAQWVCFVLLFLPVVNLHAQEITGNWQGLIEGKFRVVLEITQDSDGKVQGDLYRIDQQAPHSIPVTTLGDACVCSDDQLGYCALTKTAVVRGGTSAVPV
jgi:hypothetical protein